MLLKLTLLFLLFGSTIGATPSSIDLIDQGYRTWMRQMGSPSGSRSSFYGSVFKKKAKNRLKPCLRLRASKKPGSRGFVSVGAALRSVPTVNNCRVVISIAAGTYRCGKTVIEWDNTADRTGPNGRPLGTFASATFAVNSPFFVAKSITFKNKAPLPASGALGKQAVALPISADAAAFVGCRFIGSQDTLYDHIGRHYFRDCYVKGSVDFVFGNGLSFYRGCHLQAVSDSYGAVTAQKRERFLEETGFSFVRCKVTGSGVLFLGGAWGTFSRVVFAYTYMDRIITPKGWHDWGEKSRDMTVFYGQCECMGPGPSFGGRVPWSWELTPEEAKPFVSLDFIDARNWLFFALTKP